jgi:hypothetical protein
MTRSLPVAKSLLAAVAFVPRAILQAPGALLLFAAVLAAPALISALPLGSWVRHAAFALWGAALLIAGLMAEGALYRLAATPTVAAAKGLGLGPLGLQFGAAEVRLLVASVLLALFLGLALLTSGLLLVIAVNIAGLDFAGLVQGETPEGWRFWVLVGVGIVMVWQIFQLCIRLSLYKAATVARRRVVSTCALGLAEHNFWRLLIGLAIVSIPAIALAVLIHAHVLDAALARVALVLGLSLVQLPLSIGFLGGAYQRLEHWREG